MSFGKRTNTNKPQSAQNPNKKCSYADFFVFSAHDVIACTDEKTALGIQKADNLGRQVGSSDNDVGANH